MNLSELSIGDRISGGSAVALFLIMFLPWYGAKAEAGGGSGFSASGEANAWESFSSIDIVLLLVILVVGALVAARAASAAPAEIPAPLIILGAGVLALALVAYRLIDLPGESGSSFGVQVEISRQIGVFLGLLAAAGVAFGGYRAMA